jgi:hypothetical protein
VVETKGSMVITSASTRDKPAFVPYAWTKADKMRPMEVRNPADATSSKSSSVAKLPTSHKKMKRSEAICK